MEKLTSKKQQFVYALSGIGLNTLNLIIGTYLCSALLAGGFGQQALKNQTYLGKDLIIASLWGVFVLICKIIDGIIDIPLASWTDNLKSKYGRRRPAIALGLISTIISFILFLLIPNKEGASLGNTIYYGIILCLFYCSYTLTMVTYYATFSEIVETERECSYISNIKTICDVIYFVIGYVVLSFVLKYVNIRVLALCCLPLSLTMLIPLFMIKEPSTLDIDGNSKNLSLFQSAKCTFENKDFTIWMIVYMFMTFGVQLWLSGINEYFSFVKINMMLTMGCAFAPVPFTLIIYDRLLHTKGLGFAFRYVLLTYSIGMTMVFGASLIENELVRNIVTILAGLTCSLGIGALFSVSYSIPSALAKENEKQSGKSNSAMYFAIQGLFSGIATGIASGIVLVGLKSLNGGIIYLTLIAALGTFMAFVVSFYLPKKVLSIGLIEGNKQDEDFEN